MTFLLFLLQIGDLFSGKFNWRGVFHLFLFIFLGLIVVVFSVWIAYQAFNSGNKGKK